jgi:hypothetical protein
MQQMIGATPTVSGVSITGKVPDGFKEVLAKVSENHKQSSVANKHGKKSIVSSDAQSVKVFEFMLNRLKTDNLPDFLEVWHEGFCGKCGKRLTVPSSILSGLGPECIKKLSKMEKRDKFLELILS